MNEIIIFKYIKSPTWIIRTYLHCALRKRYIKQYTEIYICLYVVQNMINKNIRKCYLVRLLVTREKRPRHTLIKMIKTCSQNKAPEMKSLGRIF